MTDKKTPFQQGEAARAFDEALDKATGQKPEKQPGDVQRPTLDPQVERMLHEKSIHPNRK